MLKLGREWLPGAEPDGSLTLWLAGALMLVVLEPGVVVVLEPGVVVVLEPGVGLPEPDALAC